MALVMFDFDGVIADSLEQFTRDFISACRDNGYDNIKSRQDALELFDGNVYEMMMARGLKKETIDRIVKAYSVKAKGHLTDAKLFTGIGPALARIAEMHKVYIITSNVSDVPATVLKNNGIDCFLDVIGADKETSKVKKIQTLMQMNLGIKGYYVGDTKGDMLEGKKAGACTIGVAWGWHGPDRLKESNPNVLVYSPEELATLLCGKEI